MPRVHISLPLWVALLASVGSAAAGAQERRPSSTTVSGVYSITFNLKILSTLPAGTTVICRARIAPNPGGLHIENPQPVAIPVATAAGLAHVTGSSATCAAEIPFFWMVGSPRGGVLLSYEIAAVSDAGAAQPLVRSSAWQGIGVPFPAAGGSASLSFNVTF
jgi:hypothetical protein